MQVLDGGKVPIKAWIDGVPLEDQARQQLINIASMPFVTPHVAVMPDVHWGMGATIGSVLPTQGAIIPAAVGVDIGCGMLACKLKLDINQFKDLPKLRASIERSIPVGHNHHNNCILNPLTLESLTSSYDQLAIDCSSNNLFKRAMKQCGTLGGGNHFIELCFDEEMTAWVVLHSGSRYVGKTLAEFFINKAKNLCKEYFISLPDPDLAYLVQNTVDFQNYIQALHWAQYYAVVNRDAMMNLILKDISYHLIGEPDGNFIETLIDCHHNFTRQEHHFGKNLWVTRKGAVSAREDEFGIIPGSMGTKSYIVKGKGNIHSFRSCSHGAGRAMSRNAAKKLFTLEDHARLTEGVECKKDESVLDETPGAYKNVDAVMAAQSELVEIVHTLKQVLCIKG